MAVDNKLFTVAGITTHRGSTTGGVVSERTKVRYGTDMVRLVKMLTSPKKIEDRTLGICLPVARLDLVDLPQPMTKAEALEYIRTVPEFQSPADQFLIQSEIGDRAKQARAQAKRDTLTISGGKPTVAVAHVATVA